MKYLFFDLESANSKDNKGYIYSFGYVLCNDTLSVQYESKDILINPLVDKWDSYVVNNILAYSKQEINKSNPFSKQYHIIKSLIEDKDSIIFGYAIQNDIKYLVNDCNRNNLEYLQFNYIDVKDMISKLENRTSRSLSNEYFQFTSKLATSAHRSDVDAFLTKEIVRELIKKYTIEVISKYIKDNIKSTSDLDLELFNIKKTKRVRPPKEGEENHIIKGYENYRVFHKFLHEVKKESGYENLFNGKKVSLSSNYETYNCSEMLKIIQSVKNHGGEYIKKASDADLFVVYDNDIKCKRLEVVSDRISSGKEIELMELNDFLKLVKIK